MITVLISAFESGIYNLSNILLREKESITYIVIHQILNESDRLEYEKHVARVIADRKDVSYHISFQVGVAKSRNLALQLCQTKYALFTDDDVRLKENIDEIIIPQLKTHDVVTFIAEDPETGLPLKNYPKQAMCHNRLSILKVGTIEVAIRADKVKQTGVFFPEYLGAGSKYPVCDEPVFLSHLMSQGLKVKFIPQTIVYHPLLSSGKSFDSRAKIISRGIAFREIFGWAAWPIICLFYCKNIKAFTLGFLQSFSALWCGWKLQKKLSNNE